MPPKEIVGVCSLLRRLLLVSVLGYMLRNQFPASLLAPHSHTGQPVEPCPRITGPELPARSFCLFIPTSQIPILSLPQLYRAKTTPSTRTVWFHSRYHHQASTLCTLTFDIANHAGRRATIPTTSDAQTVGFSQDVLKMFNDNKRLKQFIQYL